MLHKIIQKHLKKQTKILFHCDRQKYLSVMSRQRLRLTEWASERERWSSSTELYVGFHYFSNKTTLTNKSLYFILIFVLI